MRIATSLVAGVLLAVTSCGGASSTSAKTTPSNVKATGTAQAVAADVKAALIQRLSAAPKFPNESDATLKPVVVTAEDFAADLPPAGQRQVRTSGLIADARDHPIIPGTRGAVREVDVFGTAREAELDVEQVADQAAESPPPDAEAKPFAVSGIPTAKGIEFFTTDGQVSGRTIGFAVGPYEYGLAVAPKPGASDAPSRDLMIQLATAWYGKVKSLD